MSIKEVYDKTNEFGRREILYVVDTPDSPKSKEVSKKKLKQLKLTNYKYGSGETWSIF